MATAQCTRPRAVVGAPHRTAWQLKFVLRHSAAPRTIVFYIFFTIIAGKLFLYVQRCNYNMNQKEKQYHVVAIRMFRLLKQ